MTSATPNLSEQANILPVQALIAEEPAHRRLPHDAAYSNGSAFVIDRYCPLEEASVPITDLGFVRGDAVYDVVTVSRGLFFHLDAHQDRFARSCARIRLTNPFDRAHERTILNRMVALTGLQDAYVWWAVTRGASPMDPTLRLRPESFTNRWYGYVLPYLFIAGDEKRRKGTNIIICADYIRIPPKAVDPRAKNLNSLDLAMGLFEAGDRGGDWAVLTDGQGNLTECAGSNIFIIKGNVLATPQNGCLEGITRAAALELGGEIGLTCEVREVQADELRQADEAFYTSSAGGIMPIATVDGVQLPGFARPDSITAKLHDLYWNKRWAGWHATAVDYSAAAL